MFEFPEALCKDYLINPIDYIKIIDFVKGNI